MTDPTADPRIQPVTMPKWGLSMTSGKVVDWLVAEGDVVTPGTDLADIETDKIAGTLESTQEGVLRRIVADRGVDVPVSGVLAVVAPPDVDDAAIEEVVARAREELATLAVEEAAGPAVSVAEVGGRPISYATVGDGEPVVVLVHGYGGDKNSWLFLQEPLAAGDGVGGGRTVHAVDLPGHGSSTKDVGGGSLRELADVVVGFLDAVGAPAAHLVGHSMGGAVVAATAALVPDRVRSLTLVAPAGFGDEVDAEYLRGFAAAASRRDLKPLLGRLFADEGLVTRQLVDDVLRYKRLDGVGAALTTLLGTLLDGDRQALDTAATLARTGGVPTAVVWGAQDRILPAAAAPAGTDTVRVTVVDGAGHMVHLEAPTAVLEAMRPVLDG